jgi:hypothetical protein
MNSVMVMRRTMMTAAATMRELPGIFSDSILMHGS